MSEGAPQKRKRNAEASEISPSDGEVMSRRGFVERAGRGLAGALAAAFLGFSSDEVEARAPGLKGKSVEKKEGQKLPLAELVGNLYKGAWKGPRADEKNPQDSEYFDKRVQGWKEHYLKNKKDRERLKAGLKRLLENDGVHLRMIYEIAQEKTGAEHRSKGRKRTIGETLPFDIVFLALAESHWNAFGENGAQAAGYWQFIRGTAGDFGLANVPAQTDKKARYTRTELEKLGDERLDPKKSTIAGVTYLIELRQRYQRLAKKRQITLDDDGALSYAMWAYNRGPGHVDKTFGVTTNSPVRYSRVLVQEDDTRSRRESANYVPKIMGIRLAAKELFEEILGEEVTGASDGKVAVVEEKRTAEKTVPEAPRPQKKAPPAAEKTKTTNSEADQAYERLPDIVEELSARPANERLSAKEQDIIQDTLIELERISALYIQERKKGVHTEGYARAAVESISEKVLQIQRAFPGYFTMQSGTARLEIDGDGDLTARSVSSTGESVRGEVIKYKVPPGADLGKIATWISGDHSTINDTLKQLFILNPKIKKRKNATIYRGESIQIPAQRIEVGKNGMNNLHTVAKKYYRGWNLKGAVEAIKFINNLQSDVVRVGQKLYVPL